MANSTWKVVWWAAFLAVVAATAGCAAPLTQRDKLDTLVHPFYDAWRWKKLPSLAKRIEPDKRSEFIEHFKTSTADVSFADYEVSDIEVLEDKLTAHVTVVFQWYSQSDPTLFEAQVLETWKREKRGKPWYRTGQEVVSGHMP
jgi:hypothetical protein